MTRQTDTNMDCASPRLVGEPEHGFIPRGLRREAAAYYVGISPSEFDTWVDEKIMPGPWKQGRCVIYDRRKLDLAMDQLPNRDGADENPYRD